MSPASRKQMGHAGELTVRDSGETERLALCGCGQLGQPQRPRKPCSPAHTSQVKLKGGSSTHTTPTPPHPPGLSFLLFLLKPQPQWVGMPG